MTYDEYVQAHLAALQRFAVVLTGDVHLAQDVLQSVLERAYARWESVSAAQHPHGYVRRMVVNEYLSWQRKWRRVIPLADLDDLLPTVGDHAEQHARKLALLELVSRLPPRQRATVVLRYYEDLDDSEIASILGCGVSTVRSNLARALVALRVSALEARTESR